MPDNRIDDNQSVKPASTNFYQSWKRRQLDKVSPVSASTSSNKTQSPKQQRGKAKGEQQAKIGPYAKVDPKGKTRVPEEEGTPPVRDPGLQVNGEGLVDGTNTYMREMRSTTEIYTLPPATQHHHDDIVVIPAAHEQLHYVETSGRQFKEMDVERLQNENRRQVQADVHSTGQLDSSEDVVDWSIFAKAVEQHRGNGPQKLTADEIHRWSVQVTSDPRLQSLIQAARTLEDFEMISHHPLYAPMFPSEEKWTLVVQSLAHVAFVKKLNRLIDPKSLQGRQSQNHQKSQYSRGVIGYPGGSRHQMDREEHQRQHHRQLRTSMSQGDIPGAVTRKQMTEGHLEPNEEAGAGERLFTRESYSRVKSDIESVSGDESLYGPRPPMGGSPATQEQTTRRKEAQLFSRSASLDDDLSRDRCTTEIVEKNKTVLTRREGNDGEVGGEIRTRNHQVAIHTGHAPTLSVYMGNVPERALQESVDMNRLPSRDSFYNVMPGASDGDVRAVEQSQPSHRDYRL
jgi:hypothetical protein